MNWKKVLHSVICLLVVCSILLTMVPVKAKAVVVGGGLGSVAMSLLDFAGYVFSPRVVEDIVAIGNSLSAYLQTWAANNDTVAAVESFLSDCAAFDDISLLGEDDFRLEIPEAIISGVAGWIYAILKRNIVIESPTSSVLVTSQGYTGYKGTTIASARLSGLPTNFPFWDFVELAYRTNSLLPIAMNSQYILGAYWDEYGVLYKGIFINPYSKVHANYFTLIPLSDLTLATISSTNNPIRLGLCYSMECVKSDPNYLTSSYRAVDWSYCTGKADIIASEATIYVFFKASTDSVFQSSKSTTSLDFFADLLNYTSPSWSHWQYYYFLTGFDYIASDGLYVEPSVVLGDSYSGVNDGSLTEEDFYYVGLNLAPILSGGDSLLSSMQTVSNQLTTGALTLQDYQELVSLDTEYIPGTGQLAGTVSALDSDSFFARLQSVLATPFEWLADTVMSGIKSIFVPSEDFLSSKVTALRERFSFVDSIIGTAEFIRDSINGDVSPPVIYIDLSAAEGSYYLGEKEILVDFAWYERYKDSVDALMSAILWAFFAWRVFQRAPAIIGGDAGVLVRDFMAEKSFGRKKD